MKKRNPQSQKIMDRFVFCVDKLTDILQEEDTTSSSMLVFRDDENTFQVSVKLEKFDPDFGFDEEFLINHGEVIVI